MTRTWGADDLAPALAAPLAGPSGVPGLDLARIFRDHRHTLTLRPIDAKVVDNIIACRTAALGGHVFKCPQCRLEKPVYNPCLDRHCPKCHRQRQAEWVKQRSAELLPIPYFHVVFTLPEELHPLFLANRREGYAVLFRAAAEALLEVAKTRLKARIGILSVLHTWTQVLFYHPHVHCIVTGGGLSLDGERWIATGPTYFLSTRVLATVYRGKVLQRLEQDLRAGRLTFDMTQGLRCLRRAARKRWVVDSRPPFAGPEVFLRYISRYVSRVAIDDRRLLAYDGRKVTFSYRDRKAGVMRETTLLASTFLRRFLLHLLPKGFTKIRSYGLLANGVKAKNLARCRELLEQDPASSEAVPAGGQPDPPVEPREEPSGHACPHCELKLVRVRRLLPVQVSPTDASARSP